MAFDCIVILLDVQWGSKTFEMMNFKNLESFWQISKVFRPGSKTSKLFSSKVFDFHPNLHQVRQICFWHETHYAQCINLHNRSRTDFFAYLFFSLLDDREPLHGEVPCARDWSFVYILEIKLKTFYGFHFFFRKLFRKHAHRLKSCALYRVFQKNLHAYFP